MGGTLPRSRVLLLLLLALAGSFCRIQAQNPAIGPAEDCDCPEDMKEVCGEDGVTYASTCAAECYGVLIASQGPCKTPASASGPPKDAASIIMPGTGPTAGAGAAANSSKSSNATALPGGAAMATTSNIMNLLEPNGTKPATAPGAAASSPMTANSTGGSLLAGGPKPGTPGTPPLPVSTSTTTTPGAPSTLPPGTKPLGPGTPSSLTAAGLLIGGSAEPNATATGAPAGGMKVGVVGILGVTGTPGASPSPSPKPAGLEAGARPLGSLSPSTTPSPSPKPSPSPLLGGAAGVLPSGPSPLSVGGLNTAGATPVQAPKITPVDTAKCPCPKVSPCIHAQLLGLGVVPFVPTCLSRLLPPMLYPLCQHTFKSA